VTPLLSIVLPVFNEGSAIEAVIDELDRDVAGVIGDAEIIVVDDASTDATAAILDRAVAARGRLRVEHSTVNRGHGPSVARAIRRSAGDWVFQLDSDGQLVIADFWRLWEQRAGADLVLGVRVTRQDPRHRLWLTRLVSVLVSILARRRLRDPNSPLRLFRRALWDDVEPFVGEAPHFPSIHMALGAAVRGWRTLELPIGHRPRVHGRSSFHPARLARLLILGLGELLRIRYRLWRATSTRRT
jgi:glycosyltransferase involved in cell wall biosynthesis